MNPTPEQIQRERERLADRDYFDPYREQIDAYDRYDDEIYRDRYEESYNEMLMNGGGL